MEVSSKKYLDNLETEFFINNGNKKIAVKLGALEFNHALSPKGNFLLIQLCNSKVEDSGKFVKIDTKTGEIIYSVMPEWGWANDYKFINDEIFFVVVKDYGSYELDREGNLIDRAGYFMSRIRAADFSTTYAIPKFFELHGENPDTFNLVLASLDAVLEKCVSNYQGSTFGSRALKEKANVLIKMGLLEDALQCCADALTIDPKVAVKQMRNELCRKLGIEKNDLLPSEWALELKDSVDKSRSHEVENIRENQKYWNARRELSNERKSDNQIKFETLSVVNNRKPIKPESIANDDATPNGYKELRIEVNKMFTKEKGTYSRNKTALWVGLLAVVIFFLWLFQH